MSYSTNENTKKKEARRKTFNPSDIFGGKIYATDIGGKETNGQLTVYFVTNSDGKVHELGLQNQRGDVAFYSMNGGIIEYSRDDKKPRVVAKDNAGGGGRRIDCQQVAAKVAAMQGGSANTQTITCLEAICESMACRFFDQCGVESQFSLDQFSRIACMTEVKRTHVGGGVYCVNCLE
jgi:hypothetical protein